MPILSKANDWGGGSITTPLYKHLQKTLPEGKTILELGSGWGSSKLMEHWNLYSIETAEEWFKKFNPQSFLVPTRLVPKSERESHDPKGIKGWYDLEILKKALQGLEYDLILIDGPTYGRWEFPYNLNLFDTSVPMVFDDVNRLEGQTVIKKVSLLVERSYKIYFERSRTSFGVIK